MEPGNSEQAVVGGRPAGDVPGASPEDAETDRERRLHALSELAQHGVTPPEAKDARSFVPRPLAGAESRRDGMRSNRRTVWFIVAGVLLVLALVAAVLVPRFLTPSPRPAPVVVTIDSGASTLACDQDAAWSPNGADIALVGYYLMCPNTQSDQPYEPGQVNVYSAKTGKLVTSFALDPLILRASHLTLGQPVTTANGSVFAPYIQYQAVLWSPARRQLAFPFLVLQRPYDFLVPNFPPQPEASVSSTQAGILLTNLDGTSAQVYMASVTLPRTGQAPRMEWDLQTGKLLSAAVTLPPALSYAWGGNDVLLPQQPLNTSTAPTAVPPAPVGNPIGGQSFTIWQPGLASPGVAINGTGPAATETDIPGLNLWYSYFAIWSPDARYVITPAYYGGRFVLPEQPIPSSHDLHATGQEQAPIFPPHDQALQTLYLATKYVQVAWRPDGKILATLSFHLTSGGKMLTGLVTLWNCTSGKELQAFTAFTVAEGDVGVAPRFLRWSPDGSHLFLLDSDVDGLIKIWPAR